MRKPWILAIPGICLLFGLALFAGLRVYQRAIPGLKFWAFSQGNTKFTNWVRDAPDPAELQLNDQLLLSDKQLYSDGWSANYSAGTIWLICQANRKADIIIYSAKLDKLDQLSPDQVKWTTEAGPAMSGTLGLFTATIIANGGPVILSYIVDQKQAVLCTRGTAPGNPAAWNLTYIEAKPVGGLSYSENWNTLYFMCHSSKSGELYLVSSPMDSISDASTWTKSVFHTGKKGGALDLQIVGQQAQILFALKGGVYYGWYDLDAEGKPTAWHEQIAAPALKPGEGRLATVDGRPAFVFATFDPEQVYYACASSASPNGEADWKISKAYRGYTFSMLGGLTEWDSCPVLRITDAGSQLLIGKTTAPAGTTDWYLCQPARKNEIYFNAQLLIGSSVPALIYNDSQGFHLVTYELPPRPIKYGTDRAAKAWALRQAYPIDDLIKVNERFAEMQK